MSQKNNAPIIVAIVALLAIAGGAMFYFSKNMTKDVPVAESTAPTEDAAASSTTPSTGSSTDAKAADAAAGGEIEGIDVKPGNPIVATVDGRDITRVDVFNYIQLMPANIQQLPPAAVYPLALDQVVNTRLVQNKAEDAGLESDPEVQEQLNLAKQQIIRGVYVQRAVDKEISESDLKKAYNEYVAKVPNIQEVHAAHILVDSEEKAKEIITKLGAGESFASLAAANSGDPSNKDKGGDLGWFAQADMVPEFSEAAFKIKPGEIGQTPVKTNFGWHVVKVEGKRDRPKPAFEEMKQMLQVELRRQKLEGMLEEWKSAAKIEKFDINGDPIKVQTEVAPAAGEPEASAPATPAPAAEATAPAEAHAPAAAE